MDKNNCMDDFFLYEMISKESNDSPTENGGCLPWILGGIIVIGLLSKLLGSEVAYVRSNLR